MSDNHSNARTGLLASVAKAVDLMLVESGRALAVGVIDHGDELELATRPLDGHPVEELIGFTAPDAWCGFGVAATGSCLPLPGDGCAEPLIPARTPVRLVHLVGRTEASHSLVSTESGEVLEPSPSGVVGLVDDVCRRVLGLCTTPPDGTPAALWARLWLEAVVAVPPAPGAPEWSAVAALHPAVQQVRRADPELALIAAGDLELAGRVMAETWSWEELRLRCAAGGPSTISVSPAQAAWMDEGMFSRMVLSGFAELRDLLEVALEQLSRAVGARVVTCLRSWGLDVGDGARS